MRRHLFYLIALPTNVFSPLYSTILYHCEHTLEYVRMCMYVNVNHASGTKWTKNDENEAKLILLSVIVNIYVYGVRVWFQLYYTFVSKKKPKSIVTNDTVMNVTIWIA